MEVEARRTTAVRVSRATDALRLCASVLPDEVGVLRERNLTVSKASRRESSKRLQHQCHSRKAHMLVKSA